MLIIGVIIFIIAFASLAWRKLEWAVLALAFLLPAYLIRFNAGVPMTLLEAMILIVFIVWFWQNRSWLLQRFKRLEKGVLPPAETRYPFAWPLTAWLVVSLIAVGVSNFSWSALGIWRAYFFEPALLYIVIVNVINTKGKIIKLIAALGLSAGVIALFALYQYITGDFIPNPLWASVEGRRATSFFPYPNAIGLYVGPITLMIVGVLAMVIARGKTLFNRGRIAYAWAKGAALCLIAIACAKSEGAMLGVLAGLVIFGLFANRKLRLITIGLIIAGGIAIAAVPPIRSYAIDSLLLHNFSGQVRRAQWRETWNMLTDGRVIFGAGLNGYQQALAPYHTDGIFVKDYRDPDFQRKVVFNEAFRAKVWQPLEIYMYPHNIILNFWTETGLLGVIAFLWIIILFFYYGIRSYCAVRRANDPFGYVILGLMSALIVWLVHGLVDVPYFKNDLAVLFWMMIGMMSVMYIYGGRDKKINE